MCSEICKPLFIKEGHCGWKQLIFYDLTTGFPIKWQVQKFRTDNIRVYYHYQDISSAWDSLKQISHVARQIRSTTQIWVVIHHYYGISALVLQNKFILWGNRCPLFPQASAIVSELDLLEFEFCSGHKLSVAMIIATKTFSYLKLFDDYFSVVAGVATRNHKEWTNPFNTVISVEEHLVTRDKAMTKY